MNALIKILIAATFSVLTFFGTASAALLGNTLGLPMTFFPTGTVGYNAVTDQLSLSATPASTLFPPITNHVGGTLSINVVVDSAGNVVGGVPGDDLIMTGSVGAFASPLLTGEVLEFGSLDSGGPTDTIDFRFQITGGSLAALYGASDIGVVVTVEQSNFTGDFNFDWGGIAKGNVGPIPPRQDPCIDIEKEVSVDGGSTWFDADTVNLAPGTELAAQYRLIVTNCGPIALTNVTINDIDPTLGEPIPFIDVNIGNLAPGETKTFADPNAPGFGGLDQPQRCANPMPPEKLNTAKVKGFADDGTGRMVMDDDPAWVRCQCVDIEKEVSVDGGVTWFDADTAALAPGTALAAQYRLIVSNCGATDLTGVTLSDIMPTNTNPEGVAFNVNIGVLGIGEQKIITAGFIDDGVNPPQPIAGFDLLDRPDRCLDQEVVPPGQTPTDKLLNTARVDTNEGPADEDPAWVMCQRDCALEVTKTCEIAPPPPPPTGEFKCEKPISELTMIWDGSQAIRVVATAGGNSFDIDNVQPGDEVVINGYGDKPNDVFWELFQAGTNTKIGESTFHRSCSDDDMDGPEDCGKPEGDGKGKDGFVNEWLFEGMIAKGKVLDCTVPAPTPPPPSTTKECSFETPPAPHCLGKVTAMSLRYIGGDCTITPNNQEGKAKCTGDAGSNEPVRMRVTDGGSEVFLDSGAVASVNLGDVVSATAANAGRDEFRSNSVVEIHNAAGGLIQELEIHTSCSKPLNLNDRFGGVQLAGLNTTEGGAASLGAEVRYDYVITNLNPESFTGQTVDDKLMPGLVFSGTIAPFDNVAVSRTTLVTPDASNSITNKVTVTGNLVPSGAVCEAMDTATVTRVPPPPPPPPPFKCKDAKPLDALTMIWNGGTADILVSASAKGVPLATLVPVSVGGELTVSGYAAADAPNDVFWELFDAGSGAKIGESTFHRSCSDEDMNGPEDCGKAEGDGKGKSGFINDWLFEGMAGNGRALNCTP